MVETRNQSLTDFVLLPLILHRWKWASRGNQRPTLRPVVQILGIGFMKTCGVAEGKDDGTLYMLGHFLHNFLGKCLRLRRSTDEHVRADFFDNGEEIIMLLAVPVAVFTGKVDLSVRECVTLRLKEEPWLVHTPELIVSRKMARKIGFFTRSA